MYKRQAYIQRLLRAFPDARELLEYEDYLKNQTQESASEFIRQAREDFAVPMSQRENYLCLLYTSSHSGHILSKI